MSSSVTKSSPDPVERFPALLAAVAFAAGILLAWRVWRPPMWWAVAAVVLGAAALVFSRRHPRVGLAAALAAIAALGCLAFGARNVEYADSVQAQQIGPYLDGTERRSRRGWCATAWCACSVVIGGRLSKLKRMK